MKQYRLLDSLQLTFLRVAVLVLVITGSLPLVASYYASAASPYISITSPVDGQYISNKQPVISGTTEANLTVNVYIDNVLVGSITAAADGGWSYDTSPLAEGEHSVYASTTNGDGETGTSSTTIFTVDTIPPTVTITRPLPDSYFNLPLVEGKTEPGLTVTVFIYGREATVTSDPLGNWIYFDESLPEGSHSVYAKAVDKAGNVGTSASHSFILDMTRPVVLPDIIPPDEMTRVPPETAALVYIKEKSPIDPAALQAAIQLNQIVNNTVYETIYGTVYNSVYTDGSGEQYYTLTFKPNSVLKLSTKYSVSINPMLADAAGNLVHPRTWSFTTIGNDLTENPHGNYTSNVNTCINCHRPHDAASPKINSPPDAQLQTIDNYCNACHDGTAAPLPPNADGVNKHNFQLSFDNVQGTSSCASCHNPHLTWTADNPNMLQDYYYYDHNDPTNPFIADSSEQQLCESCHPADIKNDSRVQYVKYQYNKWHTAAGAAGDYSLCLGCHDGKKAVDIATYYNGPSRHSMAASDGSPLNGHIACADCHETHGSPNIKLLKNRLGHNNPQVYQAGTEWDAASERMFCTGCHNNLTELYGKTVGFDPGIPGHEPSSTEACNSCHGGSPIVAAHAPR